MSYDPDRHHRRSIRLKGFDYSSPGAYFVTLCIQHRQPLLGEIHNGEVCASEAGEMVRSLWNEIPLHYPGVALDAFTLMPNHIHGIIVLVPMPNYNNQQMTLNSIVHRFQSLTTAKYRYGVTELGWLPFPGKLWQRNYYEHIIRDEVSLQRLRQYIADNPRSWEIDQLHPNCPSKW